MNQDILARLEQRVLALEEKLDRIHFSEAKEVSMSGCSVGEIRVGGGCDLDFKGCSVGASFTGDMDDADERLDDLESRLDEINGGIGEARSRLEALADSAPPSVAT